MKITPELRKYLSEIGRKGGKKGGPARAAKLTAEQRQEVSRKALKVRWGKKRKS
jgi:hypothetical protein